MTDIFYALDVSGGVDPDDPIGNVYIVGDNGKSITIESTYVDAWLMEMSDFIISGSRQNRIEVLEEPESIDVIYKDGKFNFFYKGEQVVVSSKVFVQKVCEIVEKLIFDLSRFSDGKEDKNVSLLKGKLLELQGKRK
ncbi:hypothetical protein [Microbulbifer halophilus]|uniref:Uncharacterized protein n=1 Tax=Microbulbifer halophilus TaxID=453963 RepID=A0ABW5E8Y1_9GAMM|nr:hypothetical protein [Microbulbifer halophilus]MCW8128532.1 hypothetical protein [Microbulbifer halophilus]